MILGGKLFSFKELRITIRIKDNEILISMNFNLFIRLFKKKVIIPLFITLNINFLGGIFVVVVTDHKH